MPEATTTPAPVETPPVPPPATESPAATPAPTETAAPPPAAEQPKPTPPADQKSAKFRAEMEAEAKQRKAELAVKREREELAKEREAIKADRELAELARTKPLEYLKRIGKTPDQIAKDLLDSDKPPDALAEARAAREELEAYKREQAAAAEAARKADVERRGQERWSQYVAQATDEIKKNADRWEYVNTDEAYLEVCQRAAKFWHEFGKEPNLEQMADEVEAEHESRADKYAKTKKWAAKHAPKPPAASGKEPKNLTNAATPAPGSTPPSDRPLTAEERVERATRRLKEKIEKKD